MINGGPESAIHRSTDGGKTWKKVTTGLPDEQLGRIGLAIPPGEQLEEHRQHDLGPTFSDQRQGAIEIEEHVRQAGTRREAGAEFDLALEPGDGGTRGHESLGRKLVQQARQRVASALYNGSGQARGRQGTCDQAGAWERGARRVSCSRRRPGGAWLFRRRTRFG